MALCHPILRVGVEIRALLCEEPMKPQLNLAISKYQQPASSGTGTFLRDNGLSIVMALLFLGSMIGQSIAGFHDHNDELTAHQQAQVAFGEYLRSGSYIESVFENWESEFLQMGTYVVLTAMLYQRGSPESKDPDKDEKVDADPRESQSDPEAPGPVRAGGWILKLYEHSLGLALFALFAISFVLHGYGGMRAYNQDQVLHGQQQISMLAYFGTARFWFESLQNWQSEFLSVLVLVLLSIVLRQRGSSESKPVASPHHETGG